MSLLFWPIFQVVTRFVYQFYATEEGLYFLRGRSWQTALIPVLMTITALLTKKLLLQRNSQNKVLIHLALCTGALFVLTCQHYIFQRIGNIFFASAVFLIPEILKSICVETDVWKEEESKRHQSEAERKRRLKERRRMQSRANWHKQYYFYGVGVTIFFGILYYVWFLLQNRINLIPYVTFF